MANYYAYVRTNYFHVNDAEDFKKFIATVSSSEGYKVELFEEKDKSGTPIFGFGCQGQPSFPDDESYEGIIEVLAGFVSDDDAIIITEVGHEKLNYLVGEARIITSKEIRYITISDLAIKTARKLLNKPDWETKNEY